MKQGLLVALFLLGATLVSDALLSTSAPTPASDNVEATLGDAMKLLPDPETAVAGRHISGDRYWVWAHVLSDKDYGAPTEESWLVDISEESAERVFEMGFGPGGGNPTVDPFDQEYLHVTWYGGWEGIWDQVQEYYSRETGELAYTLSLHSGQVIEIETPEQTLKVDYAPEDICTHVSLETPTSTDTATGLIINDEFYAFPKPLTVACSYMDISGATLHEDFDYVVRSNDVVRIGFPGVKNVEIPIPSLNLDEMTFNNFNR